MWLQRPIQLAPRPRGFHLVTREVLEALPERERMVLILRFFESMTQTQIAERIGISQMHVSRLLAKSLARLRDQLE